MITLLLISLITGLIFSYYSSSRIIISPTFLLFATFTISTSTILLNKRFFIEDISFRCYLVLILSLIFWLIGDLISNQAFKNKRKKLSVNPIDISKTSLIICCIIIASTGFEEYIRFIKIGKYLGGTNFLSYYGLVRESVVEGQNSGMSTNPYKVNYLISAFITLSRCIVYFLLSIYYVNFHYSGIRKYRYVIPVVFYIPILFFSTSRSSFIELFAITFLISQMIKLQSNNWKSNNFPLFIRLAFFGLIFSTALYILGFVRSNGIGGIDQNEMINSLSKYIGSSIFGLDQFLTKPIPQSQYLGEQTFPIIYLILEKFGMITNHIPLHAEFFTLENGHKSNVYTALREPIIDYGINGMLVSRICMGFIYGFYFKYFFFNKNNPYRISNYVLFGLITYPILMYIFSDVFYYLMNINFIESILFLLFLNKLIKVQNIKSYDI